jgi:hypothetical protein
MGGGDSCGVDDVVDAGTWTIDDDLVVMYLGYHDIRGLDASDVYFVGLIVSSFVEHLYICLNIDMLYMAHVTCGTFVQLLFCM